MSTLYIRGINPEVAELIHKEKKRQLHKNVTQAIEGIVVEWAQLRSLKGAELKKVKELKELQQNLADLQRKVENMLAEQSIGFSKTV